MKGVAFQRDCILKGIQTDSRPIFTTFHQVHTILVNLPMHVPGLKTKNRFKNTKFKISLFSKKGVSKRDK